MGQAGAPKGMIYDSVLALQGALMYLEKHMPCLSTRREAKKIYQHD
jgi:hypothetical protein